jgi:MFS family permease
VPVVPFSLEERAGITADKTQSWVSILVAVYGGALAVASPICGWAADATPNRRGPLVLGLLALGASTVMLNLGRSIAVLIVGRILQGASAAVVWCVGLALVADTVHTDEIGECMGYVFTGMSVAMLSGPLLGGVVFDKGSYNAVFAMCYGLIGVDIAMRLFMIEKKEAKKWDALDADVSTSEQVKEPTLNEKEIEVPRTPENLEMERASTPATAATAAANDTAPEPETTTDARSARSKKRVPAMFTLIKSRRLLAALWTTLALATLMTQFDSVLPLYVEETFHWGATAAGLVFLPLLLPAFFSPLIGAAIDKVGPRWFTVSGLLLFLPLQVLLRFVDHNSMGQKVLLCALLLLLGIALNLALTPLLAEITYVIEQKEKDNPGLFGRKGAYAQAYGLWNVAWAGKSLQIMNW